MLRQISFLLHKETFIGDTVKGSDNEMCDDIVLIIQK